jgi:hypothetical protein
VPRWLAGRRFGGSRAGSTVTSHPSRLIKAGRDPTPLRGSREWPVVEPDAALLSAPRASAKRLVLYIVCGKRGAYSEPDVQEIIETYSATCIRVGLDPLIAVSQLILESDNLTSPKAQRPQLDPFAIGGLMTRAGGIPFGSWSEVARIHAGLLLAYALRPGAEETTQLAFLEEALALEPLLSKVRGTAPTLGRLAAAWTREASYANRLRAIANRILEPQW